MTLSKQEILVFDYLNGSLSPSAEQDFYIQLALDPDLQQTLKAMQIVERALHKDRQAATTLHTNTREHVLGLLGMSTAPQAGASLTGAAFTTASSLKWSFAALVSSSVKWTLAVVAASSLAIGTFVVAPLIRESNAYTVEVVPVTPRTTLNTTQEEPSTPVVPTGSARQKLKSSEKVAKSTSSGVEADTTSKPLTPGLSIAVPRTHVSEKDTIKLRVKIEPVVR